MVEREAVTAKTPKKSYLAPSVGTAEDRSMQIKTPEKPVTLPWAKNGKKQKFKPKELRLAVISINPQACGREVW